MATLSLNIYAADDRNKIEKTYTAESYDLMFGTVEDLKQLCAFLLLPRALEGPSLSTFILVNLGEWT